MGTLNLQTEFERIPFPSGIDNNEIEAYPIKAYANHRLAKDFQGCPLLLISINETGHVNDEHLTNLDIQHNKTCEIVIDGKLETRRFSIIKCKSTDYNLQCYFLKICEIILPIVGGNANISSLINAINQFKELFRLLKEPSKKMIQGLWAELFLIYQSDIPEVLLNSWHLLPEDTYDFRHGNLRLDVKSTNYPNRRHSFNLKQLLPVEGFDSYIVSILTEENLNGKSLENLVDEIELKIGFKEDLVNKLRTQVYRTLGEFVVKISKYYFDAQLAKKSLQLFDIENIPRIHELPKNIFDVNFKTDLDDVLHEDLHPDLLFDKMES